jgi:hypothetical protein
MPRLEHKPEIESMTDADRFAVVQENGNVRLIDKDKTGLAKTADVNTALSAKQAASSELTALAGITPADGDVIQRVAGARLNRTFAQLKTALGLIKSDVGLSKSHSDLPG